MHIIVSYKTARKDLSKRLRLNANLAEHTMEEESTLIFFAIRSKDICSLRMSVSGMRMHVNRCLAARCIFRLIPIM